MMAGKPEQVELQVKEKKPYQAPKVLASYDKKKLEALMEPGVVGGGCSCGGGS